MKFLALFSIAANTVAFISYGIIYYFIVRSEPQKVVTSERKAFGDANDYPLYLGIVVFAMSAIYMVIPLENEMKTPKAMTKRFGVLDISFFLLVVINAMIGVSGYLKYGDSVESTITLNLPNDNE